MMQPCIQVRAHSLVEYFFQVVLADLVVSLTMSVAVEVYADYL